MYFMYFIHMWLMYYFNSSNQCMAGVATVVHVNCSKCRQTLGTEKQNNLKKLKVRILTLTSTFYFRLPTANHDIKGNDEKGIITSLAFRVTCSFSL